MKRIVLATLGFAIGTAAAVLWSAWQQPPAPRSAVPSQDPRVH